MRKPISKRAEVLFLVGYSFLMLVFFVAGTFFIYQGFKVPPVTRQVEVEKEELFDVRYIFDGDTFSVEMNGETEMVRVIGIDAPETGEKYTEKECFSEQSKVKAVELLAGKRVRLEADPSQNDKDVYGRLLRYVWLEDGTFFNQAMVEEGFAKEYTYSGLVYQRQNDFLRAQKKAQELERGLWGVCEQ